MAALRRPSSSAGMLDHKPGLRERTHVNERPDTLVGYKQTSAIDGEAHPGQSLCGSSPICYCPLWVIPFFFDSELVSISCPPGVIFNCADLLVIMFRHHSQLCLATPSPDIMVPAKTAAILLIVSSRSMLN